MKFVYSIIILVCIGFTAFAQTSCDDGRFSNRNYFDSVKVTSAVQFGSNLAVGGSQQETLEMDIYEGVGDTMSQRPVVLVGFGGSFISGDRGQVSNICEAFAKMGYVAVAFDYRVGFFLPNEVNTTLAVMRGAHDCKAAVRFLRKDAATTNTYKIDPDRIIIGGVSAGAIAAVHAAYLDSDTEIPAYLANDTAGLGGTEGISGNPGYSSAVQGVYSFSGAIGDTAWIGDNGAPIISVHETGDGTVPYGTAMVSVSGIPTGLEADGSGSIHDYCAKHGVRNFLQTYQRSGHVGYMGAEFDTTMTQVMNFMEPIACKTYSGIADRANNTNYTINVYPNPNNGSFVLNTNLATLYDVRVYNALGQEIKVLTNNQGNTNIDIDATYAGLYFVRIFETGTLNSLQTTKFLVH